MVCLLLPLLATAKIFDRCELANLLQHRFGLPAAQVATLVCIAQHSSDFNTAAFGGGVGLGGGSHGLFQISDVYWCSPPGQGKGCGLSCSRLRDDDIADDVLCVRKIYAEHQRISGDGFTAWQAYDAYCRQDANSYVAGCGGPGSSALSVAASYHKPQQVQVHSYPVQQYHQVAQIQPQGKIYSRCELAQELYYQHKLPMPQIPTWVCIAQHESSFNTAAVGRLNADGSADHGLFQISDLFWCTHEQRAGKGCHATCNQFLDSSIGDDVQCIRRIHQEHTQISGDGFNAWTVYKRNCLNQHYEQIAACFAKPPAHQPQHHPNAIAGGPVKSKVSYAYQYGQVQVHQTPIAPAVNQYYRPPQPSPVLSYQTNVAAYSGNPFLRPRPVNPPRQHPNAIGVPLKNQTPANPFYIHKQQTQYQPQYQTHFQTHYQRTGKVYNRCELAQELYFSHKFPMQDLATWVCIAEHESSFNTAAVGRLNADGSADHGLFQISDLYWCTHNDGGGKGCHIDCNRLLDSDITDDVKCVRTIHEEHTRISGDGFTAWTVYNGHCRQKTRADVANCFDGKDLPAEVAKPSKGNELVKKTSPTPKAKIYNRCELAKELYHRHKFPMREIPTWVCIAEHESSFNTAAVGKLNADGSEDHGLFQISDIYWCTHDQTSGKACHIECDRLLDSDISDDVQCIRTIHEEHTRLSGDGFNAWTVYNGHCRNQNLAKLSDCFDGNEISEADKTSHYGERPQVMPHQSVPQKPQHKTATIQEYAGNPFLQNLQAAKPPQPTLNKNKLTNNVVAPKEQKTNKLYATNPFFNGQVQSKPPPTQGAPVYSTKKPNYDHNPFLKAPGSVTPSVKPSHASQEVKLHDSTSYAQNPFLSLLGKPIVPAQAPIKPQSKPPSPSKSTQLVSRPYVSSDSFRNEVIKFTATSAAVATTASFTKQSVTTTTRKPQTASTTKPVSTTAKTTSLPLWSWQTSTTAKPTISESGNRYTTSTTRSVITNKPNTHPTIAAVSRPTTRATTRSTNGPIRTTSQPGTYLNTPLSSRSPIRQSTIRSSTVFTTRSTTRPTIRSTTHAISRPTSSPTTRPTTRLTTRPTTRTTTRASVSPTTRPTVGLTTYQPTRTPTSITRRPIYTTQKQYTTTTRATTPYPTVSKPTTRPSTTTRPLTTTRYIPTTRQSVITQTTNRNSAIYLPRNNTISTNRSTTKSPYHYVSINKPTTRSTTSTRPSTTIRYSPTTRQPPTTRSTTRYSAITAFSTRQTSTTPRPYLFTSTTKKSVTTKDPFDHPFFQKFKAKFEKTTTTTNQKASTLAVNQNQTTISPYYAKYQENKVKTGAKTVLSYDFGQNRNTTSRPKSAFDVYLNWNKN